MATITPFKLPPVPKEPIEESHIWRDWFTKLQGIASGTLASSIVIVPGPASGLGSVTSVNASGGSTGLTFTGGPITTSGTLTLEGTIATALYATVAGTIGGRLKPAKGGSGLYDFYNLGGF